MSASIAAGRSAFALVKKLGLNIVGERFEALNSIGSSFGGSSFVGRDLQEGVTVFMKYLICPRGETERAKFLLERDALKHLSWNPYKVAPKFLHFETVPELVTDVLVTEFAKGEGLASWIDRSQPLGIEEKLEVFHRVVFALSHATLNYQHRDAHPGNIILLPEDQVVMKPWDAGMWNPAVKIVDWGEALPVIFANYDDEPDHNFILLEAAPKTIGGSITSLPPEVFSPWRQNTSFGGVYESWGIGLLLNRILTGSAPPRADSLGQFAKDVRDGALERWVRDQVNNIRSYDLPGGLILSRLLRSLLSVQPERRATLSDAGLVLFHLRYENLTISTSDEVERYFSDVCEYKPPGGWRFINDFERD